MKMKGKTKSENNATAFVMATVWQQQRCSSDDDCSYAAVMMTADGAATVTTKTWGTIGNPII